MVLSPMPLSLSVHYNTMHFTNHHISLFKFFYFFIFCYIFSLFDNFLQILSDFNKFFQVLLENTFYINNIVLVQKCPNIFYKSYHFHQNCTTINPIFPFKIKNFINVMDYICAVFGLILQVQNKFVPMI